MDRGDLLRTEATSIPGVNLRPGLQQVEFTLKLADTLMEKTVKVAISLKNGKLTISLGDGVLAVYPVATNRVTIEAVNG